MTFKKIIIFLVLALIVNPLISQESNPVFENYTLTEHRNEISDIVFNQEGTLMATVSDSLIVIWKFSRFNPAPVVIQQFKDKANVNSVCFTDDGKYLVSGGYSQVLNFWDYTNGKKIKTFKLRYTEKEVEKMKSSEKKTIEANQWASSSKSKFEKEEIGTFPSIINNIISIKGTIFSAQGDNSIKLWNPSSEYGKMQTLGSSSSRSSYSRSSSRRSSSRRSSSSSSSSSSQKNKNEHAWSVNDISSPDGNSIFTASDDNTIKKWTTSRFEQTLKGHTRSVTRIVSSPNNKFIVSIGADNSIRVWGSYGNQVCGSLGNRNKINDVAFSLDGRYLATAEEDELCFWKISKKTGKLSLVWREEAYLGDEITKVAFMSMGKEVHLLSGSEYGNITSWNIEMLLVRKYYEKEYTVKKEKSGFFKKQGEFEKTEAYTARFQLGQDLIKDLDREYLAKYRKEKEKIDLVDETIDEIPEMKRIRLKIEEIKEYNPDDEKFIIVIRGGEMELPVPIKSAKNFKLKYKKAVVTATEVTIDGKKILASIEVTDPNTKKIYKALDIKKGRNR